MKALKQKLIALAILLLFPIFLSAGDNTVKDNNPTQAIKVYFKVKIVEEYQLKSYSSIVDLGEIVRGKSKNLGDKFSFEFKISGADGGKVLAEIINSQAQSPDNKVRLQNIKWEYKTKISDEYKSISSFPFVGDFTNGAKEYWIRVYPESVSADKDAALNDQYFEFDLNFSGAEL